MEIVKMLLDSLNVCGLIQSLIDLLGSVIRANTLIVLLVVVTGFKGRIDTIGFHIDTNL